MSGQGDSGTPGSFFDRVYSARGAAETRDIYDDWAQRYESDVAAAGYATPGRIAAALAEIGLHKTAPILDFGCGTGMSGAALHSAGFETLDGWDVSEGMLAVAGDKRLYRDLTQIAAEGPLPAAPGDYAAIVACGVIGAGAAPVTTLDRLLPLLQAGQFLAFSLNGHSRADPEIMDHVQRIAASDAVRTRIDREGPHLPGIGLDALICVWERR